MAKSIRSAATNDEQVAIDEALQPAPQPDNKTDLVHSTSEVFGAESRQISTKAPATPNAATGPNVTKVKINYSKDYEGKKFWKNGDIVEVSKEVADQFVELDIATIVE